MVVYGALIAKLQGTVRAFYDIDGSNYEDCIGSCFCPGFVLTRAENEILYREDKHRQVDVAEEPAESPAARDASEDVYPVQAPMQILAPLAPDTEQISDPSRARSSSSSSSKGKEVERSSKSLSTIPEASREASGAGVDGDKNTGRSSPKKQTKVHGLRDDSTFTVPTSKTTFPRLNFMDKQWFLVPANNLKENAAPDAPEQPVIEITEDTPVEIKPVERGRWRLFRRTSPPKAIEESAKHVLEDDTRSSRAGTVTLKHALVEDPELIKSHGSRFAEHLLEHDDSSPSGIPAINISHQLSDDPMFTIPSASNAGKQADSQVQPTLKFESDTADQDLQGDEDDETQRGAKTNPLEDSKSANQDKGFVATFLSGIGQPLRSPSAQDSSASRSKSEAGDAPESPVKSVEEVVGEGSQDDKPVISH